MSMREGDGVGVGVYWKVWCGYVQWMYEMLCAFLWLDEQWKCGVFLFTLICVPHSCA